MLGHSFIPLCCEAGYLVWSNMVPELIVELQVVKLDCDRGLLFP